MKKYPRFVFSFLTVALCVLFVSGPHSWAEERKADARAATPPSSQPPPVNLQALPEKERNAILAIQEAKRKVDQLMKERNELIQQKASQEAIEAKTKEAQIAQQSAIQLMRTVFPQPPAMRSGMPPSGSELSPALKQELEMLIEKRRKMVLGGAAYKDVQGVTEKIQQIYYSGAKPQQPPPMVPPKNVPTSNSSRAGSVKQT